MAIFWFFYFLRISFCRSLLWMLCRIGRSKFYCKYNPFKMTSIEGYLVVAQVCTPGCGCVLAVAP